MPDEKQIGLLRDMLDSAGSIHVYLQGVSRDAFMANEEKQDAVLRRFEIIGEAASKLTPETRAFRDSCLVSATSFSEYERHAQHHRPRLW
jgi:uncharacterized protein with HEPN domain